MRNDQIHVYCLKNDTILGNKPQLVYKARDVITSKTIDFLFEPK